MIIMKIIFIYLYLFQLFLWRQTLDLYKKKYNRLIGWFVGGWIL